MRCSTIVYSVSFTKNGLNVYKNESTRDIICLDYKFGSRSYDEEHKRLEKLFCESDEESKERIKKTLKKVESRKELYSPKKRDEIREYFYENGVDVTYRKKTNKEILKKKQLSIMKCFLEQVQRQN